MDEIHKTVNVAIAFAHVKSRNRLGDKDYLKVDCTNLKCRLCDEPCNSIATVAKHLKDRHENDEIKSMDLSYEVALCPFNLIKDKWVCVLCNLKVPTLNKLSRHMSSHYADNVCNFCDKRYLSAHGLRFHVKFNHSNVNSCRKCNMEFSNPEEKKEHLKTSAKCLGFCCVHCNKRFSSWEHKQRHLVSEHNVKAITYPCPDCETVFDSRSNFYYHYNTTHSDLPHMCSYCGKRFLKKSQLDNHVDSHTGKSREQHQCSTCAKTFTRRQGLQEHLWTHKETKRFSCPSCDKHFTAKRYYNWHMKTIHKLK